MYALIDCNNFYASCERVFRPDLNQKPIVVLSNNDGCVIARSNEAKECGIPMGAPAFQFLEVFKKNKVKVFSANFTLYGDMSNRVMEILSKYSCDQEIYSIDECFLKLDGYELFDLKSYGLQMINEVSRSTGIPVSVGIAPTKALAKAANRVAKKYPMECKGVFIIQTQGQIDKTLKWLSIQDVWGIGRKHSMKLYESGIRTAFDFVHMSDSWTVKNMSIVGLRLKRDLSGIETLGLDEIKDKKSIATTRSFEVMIEDLDELKDRVINFAVICGEKLRKQKSRCRSLQVFLKTNPFRDNQKQYYNQINIELPYATSSSLDLAHYAAISLKRIYKTGFFYKKAGVVASDLIPESIEQETLFEKRDRRHDPLMKVLDSINRRYGSNALRLAVQEKQKWKMRQDLLSPKYTTNFNDIIIIKV